MNMNQQLLQQELHNWRNQTGIDFNIGCTWHVPNAMRYHQQGYDDIWLSKTLNCYLNKVDRHLFKAAHRNRGVRLPRFIFLEHTAGVGWHAHGYLAQAPKLTAEATIQALQAHWLKHCKNYKTQAFENRLFHAVEIDAGFNFYAAKQAFSGSDTGTQSGTFSGKMDINNVVTNYKH
jgi:hypothetical protein